MNPEDVKELVEKLLQVGEFLGSEAYRLALKQVYVDVVKSTIWLIFGILLSIPGWLLIKKSRSMDEYEYWEIYMTSGWILIALSVSSLMFITEIVGTLMNPEWYAVMKLLNLIK